VHNIEELNFILFVVKILGGQYREELILNFTVIIVSGWGAI